MWFYEYVGFVDEKYFADVKNQIVYDLTQGLMEKLAVEAFEVAMVSKPFFLFIKLFRIIYLKNQIGSFDKTV